MKILCGLWTESFLTPLPSLPLGGFLTSFLDFFLYACHSIVVIVAAGKNHNGEDNPTGAGARRWARNLGGRRISLCKKIHTNKKIFTNNTKWYAIFMSKSAIKPVSKISPQQLSMEDNFKTGFNLLTASDVI